MKRRELERGAAVQNLLIATLLLAAVAVAVVAIVRMDPRGERSPRTGSRYIEDVFASTAIDPERIGWNESTPPLRIPMDAPRGLAVDAEDRICVIGDRLAILTRDGKTALRTDVLAGDYRALTVDARGRIVAAAANRVDVFEVRGATIDIVRSVGVTGKGVDLTAVAIAEGGIFAADSGGRRVVRLPPSGGGDDVADMAFEVFAAGFFVPSTMELASSPDGELTTVDPGRHHVQTRDGYGDVIREFGRRGGGIADFHGCCNPIAIAVCPDGRVVTAEKGIATTRVKVYGPGGELDSIVAGPDSFDRRPDGPPILLDVAVDSSGRVLVLDPARRQVRVFTRKPR